MTFFFNQTYFPLLGPRLAWAMGERFKKVWAGAWDQVKPISYVRADASQFETALVNTAVNARDAMRGEGESAIRIAREQPLPAIRVHAGAAGPFVAVSVIDEGCGIPMDRVSRIFEPFFTLKEDGKGIGLGLSQVIGFAEQSGGDVDVSSAVGRGTAFMFYLPDAEAAAAGLTSCGNPIPPSRWRRRSARSPCLDAHAGEGRPKAPCQPALPDGRSDRG